MKIEILKGAVIRFVPENSKDCFDLGAISTKIFNETHFTCGTGESPDLIRLETGIGDIINFITLAKVK